MALFELTVLLGIGVRLVHILCFLADGLTCIMGAKERGVADSFPPYIRWVTYHTGHIPGVTHSLFRYWAIPRLARFRWAVVGMNRSLLREKVFYELII